ncbi:hypothetical protein [Chryseobacterium sp.]|uniref:hypothetical protein n=1 Tax=Chryseobacterium sp. TaxID=1871047 RepID=UPI00388E7917
MEEKLPQKKISKWKKVLLIILGCILILALIFPFALNIYLKNKLPQIVNEKTPYQITLKNFDLSLFNGDISAHDIAVHTKPTKDTTVTHLEGTVKSLKIENFGIWNAIFNKSYHVDNINLINANIKATLGKSKKKKNKQKKEVDFGVKNILVTNGNFDVKNSKLKNLFTGKNVNINVTEIYQSKDDAKLPIAFKDFKIDAQDVLITMNDYYQIIAKKIDAKNKQLAISEFHLNPIESPGLYNAKNVFDLKVNHVLADNFSVDKDSLIIDNAVFSKPELIITSTNKKTVKQNPKEVNLKIGIKNIDIKEGNVLVQQKNKVKTASVDKYHINLKDIVFDKNTVKEKIPFVFSSHDVQINNVYFKIDPLQALSAKKITANGANTYVENFQMMAIGKSAAKDVFNIKTDKIEILKNASKFAGQQLRINLGAINIHKPQVEIISATQKNKKAKNPKKEIPDLLLNLGELNFINGTFTQKNNGKDKVKVGNFSVNLRSITTNKDILKEDLPFHMKSHLVTAKSIDVDAGKYYTLKVGDVKNTGKITTLNNFAFLPKYSRKQFNKMISVEEDLYTIKIKSVNITDKNSVFAGNTSIDIDKIGIDGIDCNIFHDLTPPDDSSVRYMFSKKLRDVKFPLFVKDIDIKNSKLSYEEITEKAMMPGKLTFENFNAKVSNVNSAKMKGRPTLVQVDSNFKFFGAAPTDIHWEFDVANKNDDYAIKGTINDLSVENANLFVRPYLNVSLDGKIQYLKFDYRGDNKKIAGNFYFKYTDMHVNLLNKKTGEEKKVLSSIANIFIKNDSKGEPNHVEVEKERDPNKSFFNTLWQGIMEGLKKYLI